MQIRAGNRSVITKLENEVSATISSITSGTGTSTSATKANLIAKIESISTSLRQKQQYVKELNDQLIEKIKIQRIEREIEEAAEWDSKIFEVINKIEQIKLGNYTSEQQPSRSEPGQVRSNAQHEEQVEHKEQVKQEEQQESSSLNSSFIAQQAAIRLPKINLPKFGGDITEFNAFWQSFKCAVHTNENITGVHKMNYLMNLLEGPAY